MIGKICGTGSYVPEHVLDNDDLSKIVETNDKWIRERTGVIRRHIIEDDTTVTMAAKAAKRAVENGKTDPEEIDLILVATISSDVVIPSVSCMVQKEIGAVNATCFDLGGAACSGYVFAYNTAQAYIASGMYKCVLVIGAESLSNLVDWEDRGTCILFGDGAGATVIKAGEGRLYSSVTHSDGTKGDALTCNSRHRKDWELAIEDGSTYMRMDGQAVFKFAVKRVPEVISEVLKVNKMAVEEIDYFILHQANQRIVESVAKRLKTEIDKFPMNLSEYGNTSSASIPILLDEMNRSGKFKQGQNIIIAGFGAGLSWGASLLKW